MILSPGRGYVFVHIPKTGGTALSLALEARAMRDDLLIGDTPKARRRRGRLAGAQTRGRLWKHATLADVEGLVPDAVLDGLFAFTLVRNPWDRIVSYYHWLQGQRFDHPAVGLAQSLAFDAFVLHPQTQASFRATPAAHYMRRSDGREQCKAYVRLEHLAEDMAPVAFHLGFMPAVERINTSERDADYRRYYTEQTAEAVAEACAEDIARFGYCFDTRQGP
ncbi:MAG: sulfotransferase family 2 domain-containing protein [Pseudooceanicola sp.]|nr:sulfotransferase family 2 domain-containing protein [Pseudooceanicola sp.]